MFATLFKRIFPAAIALVLSVAVNAGDKQLTVFAAASTTEAVRELATLFTQESGMKCRLNLGSSGDLARQMEQNGPADIFISAAKNWADYAAEHGLVAKNTMKPFLTNDLVVVVPQDSKLPPFKITKETKFPELFVGRLSIGDPAHVPAGQYAVAALKYYGWIEALSKRLLPAANVRAALMVVEMGEADLGIVYSTDVLKSKKVKCVAVFPSESYPKIVYILSIGKNAAPEAVSFYNLLLSERGAAVFKKYGFSVIK